MAKKERKGKTKKEQKFIAIKDEKENLIENPIEKLHGMNLEDYISKKFRKELDKEFGHTHTIPIAFLVYIHSEIEKNKKAFIIYYDDMNDVTKEEITIMKIADNPKITKSEMKKLKNILECGKYIR